MGEDCKNIANLLDERIYSNFNEIKNVSKQIRHSTTIYDNCLDLCEIRKYLEHLNLFNNTISHNKNNRYLSKVYFYYVVAFETFKDAIKECRDILEKNTLEECKTPEQILIYLLNQLIYIFPQKGNLRDYAELYVQQKKYMEKISKLVEKIKNDRSNHDRKNTFILE